MKNMKGSVTGSPSSFVAGYGAVQGNCWNTEATEATDATGTSTATANSHRMTRIERMKGQRQPHSLWAWRARLCAETPTKAVAFALALSSAASAAGSVAVAFFRGLRGFRVQQLHFHPLHPRNPNTLRHRCQPFGSRHAATRRRVSEGHAAGGAR